jgi:heat shock protein HtpX
MEARAQRGNAMLNNLKTAAGMAFLTFLLMWMGHLFGGNAGLIAALILAGAGNFFAYYYSDKLVLSMYNASELSEAQAPEIHRIVEDLARDAGIPKPPIYLIPSSSPNAFATGRGPEHAAVAVTAGILEILGPRQLRGVLAHELGHVVNRDVLTSTITATLVGALGFLAQMAQWSALMGGSRDRREGEGSGAGLLVAAILTPIIATLVQLFVSRQREFAADEYGAHLCGDPLSLASALQSLERGTQQEPLEANPATAHMFILNPLTGGGIQSLLSTHPSTDERVARLQEMAQQ